MRPLLLTALLLIPVCGVFATSTDPEPGPDYTHPEVLGALSAIDAWLAGTQHYERVPGISVGIVHDQELLFARGYGMSNLESARPADSDTLYSICSISKLFTAIGIMQQRDAGELSLRDPVSAHLDWFDIEQTHGDSPPIRVEGLLTHSSGLPRESDFPYWRGPEFPFPTREQLIERLEEQEMLYASERLFQYSNLGLSLAGEVISEVSGEAYQDYVTRHILTPLGMGDTRPFYPEDLRGEQLAIGYTGLHRNLERDPVPPFFTRGVTAAAGFTSSVRDLARFASWQFDLLGGADSEVLDANTLREMQRVHWVDPDWDTTWGLGFVVRRQGDRTQVSHGGGCPGYITSFTTVPSKKVAAIVLTNAGDGPAGRLANGILDTILPALAKAKKPAEETAPDLTAYEGNFDAWPWGGEMAVRQVGDKLAVIYLPSDSLGDDGIDYLKPDGEHSFVRLSDSGEEREPWRFELDESGRASRIWRHSGYWRRMEP